ncbi:DUF2293 domain-containing protein [Pseudovibrio sp. Tun.PSC04-5.I4]|uniref:DUF2293 domain-containing protein n=1 Tax=Pseudovibrio sp. Tun.PSC04-5.I4 TaxID=1798213 RepID=UPI000886002A|nr:DUF2293 domain-containing protein [Pseudovibrio sp. Tun.PSC04-5.I4]SDR35401.1 hypothetical protein SAMN04515695_4854 [Pseudovibrio sp. Tun.PSC04-5.I4]
MGKTKRQQGVTQALQAQVPFVPYSDALEIRRKANQPHLRKLPGHIAVFLAVTSYVRHQYTDYDQLLDTGLDRDAARYCVAADMETVIADWGGRITAEELLATSQQSGEQDQSILSTNTNDPDKG